jgi:hypothetical protein
MVKEIQYTSIRRVLDNLMDHPMLRDITLEQVVRYTVRFIGINGLPKMYQDKIAVLDVHEFRAALPCDLISIIQVKDNHSGICLRSMTDSFTPGMEPKEAKERHHRDVPHLHEMSFKTQGRVLYTSFPEGQVEIAYKAIPLDEDGFPLLIDNENYLAALEAYIKKQVFTIKFDQGKLAAGVLQNVQQEYAWLAGQLKAEFMIPSVSEMQSLMNAYNSLIPRMSEFYRGFRDAGDRELIRRH